jgi:hypothetical protein
MDDEELDAFADAWLRDHAAVLDEMVALVGDEPSSGYGAALEAALVATPG